MGSRIARSGTLAVAGLAAALAAAGLLRVGWGADAITERVSVSSAGVEANAVSLSAVVSADGRFVAFASDASNLVPDDMNVRDIFMHDRVADTTELVSIASDGSQANRSAFFPALSGDGRYVVFQSDADNLVANDANGADDIFVRDRVTGTTERISISSDGTEGNDDSITPSISADGRYVPFTSRAGNLVEGDTNDDWDVFVHDRQTGVTELVSVASDGTQGNLSSGWLGAGRGRISGDGRYVVFGSFADNLVPGDTNDLDDVFLRDRVAGITERISVSGAGGEGNAHSMYPDVSDDGRYVVFHSAADNLVADDTNGATDVFLRDRLAGTTMSISTGPGGAQAGGSSRFAVISADGSVAAFESTAANLVPDDSNGASDIFVYDLASGDLERVSIADGGGQGDGASSFADTSGDGSVVAFESDATNLVPGDTNGVTDAFAWGKPTAASATPTPSATPTNTPTPTSTPCPSDGDVNGDGMTNSLDALFILQFVAGLLSSLPNADEADVNEDGRITSIDAALILQFDAGILFCLPP